MADPDQAELPFQDGFRPARERRRVALRRAWRRAVDHRSLRRISWRAALLAVAAGLGRWALRIALPIGGAATMVHLFPYNTTAAGLHFRVQGSVLTKPGVSADTTVGNWQFPHVDGLPIGVHISPENVDLLRLATAASADSQGFTDRLRSDLSAQLPAMAWWLGGEVLIGILFGLAVAAGVNMSLRYLRGRERPPREWRRRGLQLVAALAVVLVLVAYGAASYNPRWTKESRLTGTLGAVQLVPEQLEQFYNHQSKAFDVISAIAGIQAQLQNQIGASNTPDTAYNIMYISDMHLASTYPLVQQYAENFAVKLIVNTGDETEFGSAYELSDTYLDQVRAITKTVPMIWLAGNHDSPATVATMRSIPGVTVLGTKTERADGGFQTSAQEVTANGLIIAGVPDPRVYGGGGAYGSDKDSETDPLEKSAVDAAVKGMSRSAHVDVFATHEPVAAKELAKELPGQIRQLNAGHTHAQNKEDEVQTGSLITLIEGSTGAGGLDNISSNPPPVEFSIESVASNCQFTKVVRFQLAAGDSTDSGATYGQRVSATTIYLKPQDVDSLRFCGSSTGVSAVRELTPR